MQCIQHSVEEVALWETVFVLAFKVRQVFKDIWRHPRDLGIDQLDGELRPLGHFASRHVLCEQDSLPLGHDVLEILETSRLERWEQDANYISR